MASSSNPQAVKSEAKCLSDAALAELQQLATSHPEAVAFELKYNYNCHVVVSVPHLVAAIARTTGKAFFEVAVYKEQQELWAFISASMQTVLPEKGKKGKSKGLLKPFWPGGVPAPSNVGDHISLPSPAAIVRLGPAQERFGHGTNSLREAVIQDWARGQPFDRVAYDAAKKQLTLQSSKKRKGEPLQSDEESTVQYSLPSADDGIELGMARYFAATAQIHQQQMRLAESQMRLASDMTKLFSDRPSAAQPSTSQATGVPHQAFGEMAEHEDTNVTIC